MKYLIIISAVILLSACGTTSHQRYTDQVNQINMRYSLERESLQKPVRVESCAEGTKRQTCWHEEEMAEMKYRSDAIIYAQQLESIERARLAELNNLMHQYNAYLYQRSNYRGHSYATTPPNVTMPMMNAVQTGIMMHHIYR